MNELFGIIILVVIAVTAWELYSNWEIVKDTVLSTIR